MMTGVSVCSQIIALELVDDGRHRLLQRFKILLARSGTWDADHQGRRSGILDAAADALVK